jgi:hypothetical protein
MKKRPVVGMMLYCSAGDSKSVFTEEKYKALAGCFVQSGITVETVLYNDDPAEKLRDELRKLDALLVWVNPIEQGRDRTVLDQLLLDMQDHGVFVSAVPETIVKIGTKKVLFDTRNLEWGSDVEMYSNFDEFKNGFPGTLTEGKPRVLKQFRGNGGNGVFKVKSLGDGSGRLSVLHALRGSSEQTLSLGEFWDDFLHYFENGGPMLNQVWNDNLTNGMVRCYMTGKRVAGFGYQEINALFPGEDGTVPPGKRFYFTENCALFIDLRMTMEDHWIDELTTVTDLSPDKLPVIWDADFFINSMEPNSPGRYTLCEINVSSVSPFPESAIPKIVDAVNSVIAARARSHV